MAFLNVPAPKTPNAEGERITFHLRDLDIRVSLLHWHNGTRRFVPHQVAGCSFCNEGGSRISTRYRLVVNVEGKGVTWLMTPQAFNSLNSVIAHHGLDGLADRDLFVYRTGIGIDTRYHVGVEDEPLAKDP